MARKDLESLKLEHWRMMDITIPGRGSYHLHHLVLDVNGTIAAGGRLIDGVRHRLLWAGPPYV
jgi:hypothetical protein